MVSYELPLLLCVVLAVKWAAAVEWDTLNIRITENYELPLTDADAKKGGWEEAIKTDLNLNLYTWTSDVGFLLLYDKNGNIAGIRYKIAVDGVDSLAKQKNVEFRYDYDKIPMYTRQKKDETFNEDFWYFDILFTSPEVLKKGGRPGTITKGTDEVALGVYVKLDGSWLEISRDESEITKQGFVKQHCLFTRGQHYFYKLSSKSECTKIQGFMVGYDKGRLLFAGYASFGADTGHRKYIESASGLAGMSMFQNVPQCFSEMVRDYGALCSHVYFKKLTYVILCPAFS